MDKLDQEISTLPEQRQSGRFRQFAEGEFAADTDVDENPRPTPWADPQQTFGLESVGLVQVERSPTSRTAYLEGE
jgi:hypothetical protein